MTDIKTLTEKVIAFRDARDWKQFHNAKDSALALSVEASELLELFRFKNGQELEEYAKSGKAAIARELIDVLYWTLLMINDLEINVEETLDKKLEENDKKYPIEKSKGKATKYTDL